MTEPSVFDGYASDYDDVVQRAIGASGESVQYFADLKARLSRRELAARLPRRILDFGCGVGNTTRALADAFPAAHVTGVDQSPESIASAAARSAGYDDRVAFRRFAGSGLPFQDAAFDAVFTSCVLHHISRDEHLHWVHQLGRVLRPGGTLLVFEHNPYNPLTRRVVRACPFDAGVVLLRGGYARALVRRSGLLAGPPRYYFFAPRFLHFLRPMERVLAWLPMGAQYYVAATRPFVPV